MLIFCVDKKDEVSQQAYLDRFGSSSKRKLNLENTVSAVAEDLRLQNFFSLSIKKTKFVHVDKEDLEKLC